MDNRGTPERINSQIRRYEAYHRIQDPSEVWPFEWICEFTPVMHQSLHVPLSNRRGKQVVEAAQPSSRRVNMETKNAADENNRETPIVISSGSEDDSDDDDAAIANVGDARNASASNPANVSEGPNEGAQVEDRNGKRVASEIEIDFDSESERDSDADADAEFPRQLNVPRWKPLRTQNGESSTRRDAENVVNLGAEYDRELEVAIQESLNALKREHDILPEGVTRPESEAAEGNVGDASASNPVMSHCPNEDSVDERAQVEALEAEIGKLISTIQPTDSMPRPPVSSRGRALKPTVKLLELPNATVAPLPSKRKRKDGASIDRQTKQKAAKPAPAVPRFNEGDTTLNRRPRGLLRRQGIIDVSEPRGPGSVVGQASPANGMVNTNGSGTGVEVGVSEPSGSGSLGGQVSEVNEVGRQTDMAAPVPEFMVCVTNRNPMDLPVEEAMEYMRSEN